MHPTVKLAARFDEEMNAPDDVPVHQVKEFSPDLSFGGSASQPGLVALALSDNWRDVRRRRSRRGRRSPCTTRRSRARAAAGCRRCPACATRSSRTASPDATAQLLGQGLARLALLMLEAGAVEVYPVVPRRAGRAQPRARPRRAGLRAGLAAPPAALPRHPPDGRAPCARWACGIEEGVGPDGSGEAWRVIPSALRGPATVDVGNAGTVMRFLPPVAALADGPVRFDGDPRSHERPLHGVIDALRALGARIDDEGRGALPLTVHGAGAPGRRPGRDRRLLVLPVRERPCCCPRPRFNQGVRCGTSAPRCPRCRTSG